MLNFSYIMCSLFFILFPSAITVAGWENIKNTSHTTVFRKVISLNLPSYYEDKQFGIKTEIKQGILELEIFKTDFDHTDLKCSFNLNYVYEIKNQSKHNIKFYPLYAGYYIPDFPHYYNIYPNYLFLRIFPFLGGEGLKGSTHIYLKPDEKKSYIVDLYVPLIKWKVDNKKEINIDKYLKYCSEFFKKQKKHIYFGMAKINYGALDIILSKLKVEKRNKTTIYTLYCLDGMKFRIIVKSSFYGELPMYKVSIQKGKTILKSYKTSHFDLFYEILNLCPTVKAYKKLSPRKQ